MKKVIKLSLIVVFFILLISTSSKVFGANDFDIKIVPDTTHSTSTDITLNISISTTRIFDSLSSQAVQIIVGEESANNKWTDLSSGKNGVPLKKTYNYVVKNNGKVTVRIVSWNIEDKSDLQVLASQDYQISNIDKTKPVIEKIDVTSTTNNSISLNIVAKDNDSGIAKYTCVCDSISYNKSDVNSKFDITGLEAGREYNFVISVEDKLGNTTTTNQKIKTQNREIVVTDTSATTQNITVTDNTNTTTTPEATSEEPGTDKTISNKKLPNVGTKDFVIVLVVVSIFSFIIIKTKDRN